VLAVVGEYRRITAACAARDWVSSSHDDVVSRHKGDHLLRRFLTDKSLDHCYAGSNVLDRARNRPKGAPAAGPHVIGNFHIRRPAARRAWLWRDTGELDPAWKDFKIDWMIAQGARRYGHPSDLQVSHADMLYDPHDRWRPGEVDYDDLAREHERAWAELARHAVRLAVHEAQAHRGALIPVDIDKVSASVAQGFSVGVDVVEELAERWIVIERLAGNRKSVAYEVAYALADAAFDGIDDDDVTEILQKTTILDGAYVIDPGRSTHLHFSMITEQHYSVDIDITKPRAHSSLAGDRGGSGASPTIIPPSMDSQQAIA